MFEACAVCKTMKYGGWAGDWCDVCKDDTQSVLAGHGSGARLITTCRDCGGHHDPDIRCPNYHGGMQG